MIPAIPAAWRECLAGETEKSYFKELDAFLDAELAAGKEVLPAREDIFAALQHTSPEAVKVVLLGQDPYPTPGHAHGLCFSVRPDVRPIPGSLRNIYKELVADVGFVPPGHGCLEAWADQGVLLLNAVLTVRAGDANSHQKKGWEVFTTRVIEAVSAKAERVVFVLWGRNAQQKRELITNPRHAIVECAHPSPLSARLFLGCRCFSRINQLLVESGRTPVVWQLPVMDELLTRAID
jgi:uracil-DNA glycosylase